MSEPRWWGWGRLDRRYPPKKTERVLAFLQKELGLPRNRERLEPPELEQLNLPESTLDAGLLSALEAAASPARIRRDAFHRLMHSAGKSYRDLIRLRLGHLNPLPQAVLYPESSLEVSRLLEVAATRGVAVVPFGGGTSVVGGVEGPADRPFLSLDLTGMARCLELDAASRTATFEAGILGPELETLVNASGLTLGHFPQSFEFSTLGGWVAARSAGQNSTRYGKIEDMVMALRLDSPGSTFDSLKTPASATGPDLVACVVGSEGVLGVISEVTVRLQPRPEEQRWRALFVPSFEEGADLVRRMVQSGLYPAVTRLSDSHETYFALATQAGGMSPVGLLKSLAVRGLRSRARKGGCLLLLGLEGSADEVDKDSRVLKQFLKKTRGVQDLGAGPARGWHEGRFELPYLRDDLLTARVMVETLETATAWSNLVPLYHRLHQDIAASLGVEAEVAPVLTHLSHAYPDGASLYVTFMAPQSDDPEGQWRAVKTAACEAILAMGGTISHHHGVGRDHAPWLKAEKGELGIRALRGLKQAVDGPGIMNPGVLLPEL